MPPCQTLKSLFRSACCLCSPDPLRPRCGCPWWTSDEWDARCIRCGWDCESSGCGGGLLKELFTPAFCIQCKFALESPVPSLAEPRLAQPADLVSTINQFALPLPCSCFRRPRYDDNSQPLPKYKAKWEGFTALIKEGKTAPYTPKRGGSAASSSGAGAGGSKRK